MDLYAHLENELSDDKNQMGTSFVIENRGWQTLSEKDKMVNILGFVSCIVSVTATQLCSFGKKVTTDNI